MIFVAIGWDSEKAQELRPQVRERHLAHWAPWDEDGRAMLVGPFLDKAGSMFVVVAESADEVESHLKADPYVEAGVFERWEIHPFKGVLPSERFGDPNA